MSLVFSSLGRRMTVAAFSALWLAGCSGTDRIPFADVGGPRAGDQLIGRVDPGQDGQVLVGRVGDPRAEAAAFAPPPAAQNAGSDGIDYLATSEPIVDDGSARQSMTAMVIPDGGVNIDGELGIGAEPQVAGSSFADSTSPVGVQPHLVTANGAMAMAEGNTSQPVVDGIGFDEPTQIVTGPSGPQPAAQEMLVAGDMPEEGGILPLSVDSGNSGLNDPVPVETRRVATQAAPAGRDCSLYLDKRNCR
ncbi:MAG: hypothetical protein O9309_17825 [Rhizobium sp.]|nr:hypothetical protein [Rhizobium sp.]MCZ8352722.1 hypothetical protein [Rhizobium sp.]